jgi:hypothetical protein
MKTNPSFIYVAVLGAALTSATALRANNLPARQLAAAPIADAGSFQTVAFSDTAEAATLRQAYIILATGDHDYKGHRVGAMQQVKSAADLLGLDVAGDARARQPQVLSDDKMRAAKDMIVQVLGAAEVKDQKRVVKHLNEAVHQINVALGIK